MNPLTQHTPHIIHLGMDNFQSWIHSGFDNYLFTPNGKVHRLLTRLAIENLFHPFQPFIKGQMFHLNSLFNYQFHLFSMEKTQLNMVINLTRTKSPRNLLNTLLEKPKDSFISGFSIEELKKNSYYQSMIFSIIYQWIKIKSKIRRLMSNIWDTIYHGILRNATIMRL